ncbi:MAG: Crp/Fnr family transcriptional regulator [Trichlorobacter sp.]|uniref:Crp/Fnr family transcriptional regulator n=1 Tax=Trichlorobacter sp. TaxID=2911007 RepID=UPI00256AF50A|nr:Crp/Fnr family transcriptional regulator [Trichlorobacter sp.]MDK9716581.1 Crp/Fnr family transcriptional regulator [Trichlorobacter sp.]
MRSAAITPDAFTNSFPRFRSHQALLEGLLEQAQRQSFQAGTHLYWEGDSCSGIAFLLSGSIRVYRCSEAGREITLYEIGAGETCILNASCILGEKPYPANAVTLAAGEFVLIPAASFRRMLGLHEPLRSMIFSLLSERLGDIMELVNEVAFRRMDERLMEYLVEKSDNRLLLSTHQKIASDLGTSREVVSRILKEFERQGRLQLTRSEVRLLQDS